MQFDRVAWIRFAVLILVSVVACYSFREAWFFEVLIQVNVLIIAAVFGNLLADAMEFDFREWWRKRKGGKPLK